MMYTSTSLVLFFLFALFSRAVFSISMSATTNYRVSKLPTLRLWPFVFTTSEIESKLQTFAQCDFNHEHSGYAKELSFAAPTKFQVRKLAIKIGEGDKDFEKATNILHQFQMTNRLSWAKVITPNRMSVGTTIGTLIRCYFFIWALNPCKIVSIVSGCKSIPTMKNIEKYSEIVFSTLAGHLIAGEERFRVVQTSASTVQVKVNEVDSLSYVQNAPALNELNCINLSDKSVQSRANVEYDMFYGAYEPKSVVFEMYSYTKGSGLLGSLSMPFIRPLQKAFFRDQAASMMKIMKIES